MKIISWNVNSVRARIENIINYIKDSKPDILLLQEIKTLEETFPRDVFKEHGYESYVFGQKSYNGVAIISKHGLDNTNNNFIKDDLNQSRIITAELKLKKKKIELINIYVPNGNPVDTEKYEYKKSWLKKFITSNVYTRTDLQQLRRWMRTSIDKADGATKFDPNIAGSGIDGWRKVQKDVLEYIMEKAQPPSNARTGGSIDVVPFNSAKLDKVLDDIGMDKLKTIFSPEQVKYLRDLRIALKDMKSPVGSERSPSGGKVLEAVEYATQQGLNTLSRMTNVFGGIADNIVGTITSRYADNAALDAYGAINNTRRNRAVEELTSRTTGLTGAMGAAGTTQTVGRDDG